MLKIVALFSLLTAVTLFETGCATEADEASIKASSEDSAAAAGHDDSHGWGANFSAGGH